MHLYFFQHQDTKGEKMKKNITKNKKTIKNQKNTKDYSELEKKLIEMKSEIISSLETTSKIESDRDIGDEIDDVTQTMEKEIAFDLSENEKHILKEIDIALSKIAKGTFGICELCGKEIEHKRIKHIPYARYCIKCQQKQDK